jgi:hypothetical protein
MKLLVLGGSNVVLTKTQYAMAVSNGIDVGGTIFAYPGDRLISIIEVPDQSIPEDFADSYYCYDSGIGFYLNPDWLPVSNTETQIKNLQDERETLRNLLAIQTKALSDFMELFFSMNPELDL